MKRLLLIFIATVILLTPLQAHAASTARWNNSGTAVIAEPSPTAIMFATRDPDELPIIPAPGKPESKQGDADGNGEINYMDALLVLRHSIGLEQLGDGIVVLCDVDKSGYLNYMDALLILRYSIGLIDCFT